MEVKVFAVSRSELSSECDLVTDSCRLCMARNTTMKKLFDTGTDNIVEMIRFCTGVEFTKEADLPSQICESCHEDLSVAHEFKKLCLSADQTFRKYIAFNRTKLNKNSTCLESVQVLAPRSEDKNRNSNVSDSDVYNKYEMVIEGERVKEEMLEEQKQNDSNVSDSDDYINYEMVIEEEKMLEEQKQNDSSSDSDEDYTPPDMLETAVEMPNDLPEKSKKKYEKCYESFMDWRRANNGTTLCENVLLAYFQELSSKFKSSTLWTLYSMLKSTLSINHQVDISRYSKLQALLKRKAKGYQGKKSKTFSSSEINKFLNEAPDQIYLSTKIALIFGIVGACRRQELYNLQFKDVEIYGSTILVRISNPKTKVDRSFTVTGRYYEFCKQYMQLRPETCNNRSFFVSYKSGKCTEQSIGINKFGNEGKTIAKYLNLPNPELYTGHCFRRTSATILVDAEGDILTLKRHSAWRSTAVAES